MVASIADRRSSFEFELTPHGGRQAALAPSDDDLAVAFVVVSAIPLVDVDALRLDAVDRDRLIDCGIERMSIPQDKPEGGLPD